MSLHEEGLDDPRAKTITAFLGMPGYGSACGPAVRQFHRYSVRRHHAFLADNQLSLLAFSFNLLFATAVNLKATAKLPALKYFILLHSDIEPESWWADTLIDEAEATGADVLSVASPIKSEQGLLSMGLGRPDDRWTAYSRLTVQQLERLPPTFSAAELGRSDWPLLVNTGCLLMRLDRPWLRCFPGFHIDDRILWQDNGTVQVHVEPEDWRMSRWAWAMGLKVLATKKVRLHHHGGQAWPNYGNWGTADADPESQGPLTPELLRLAGRPVAPPAPVQSASEPEAAATATAGV